MDDLLAGVKPVNGGVATPAPSAVPAVPTPAPQAGVQSPDASTLQTAQPLEQAPVEPVQPVVQQQAPVQPVEPVVAPVAEPVAEPSNFFDPKWTFTADLDDTPADKHLGRVLEKHQINGESLVKAVFTGQLSDADDKKLQDTLGDHYEYTMETVKQRINEGVQQERTRIYTAVGGEDAWGQLSNWVGDKIDASKKGEVNSILKAGGLQAELLAQSLMSDFNQYATQEEKNSMALVINADKAGGTPNAQPVQAVAPLMTGDSVAQPAAQQAFDPIYSARQLAEISSEAKTKGQYTPQFEDYLAARLKDSKKNGVYKRISVETKAPADLKQKLRDRI